MHRLGQEKYRFDYCLHWLVGTSHGAFHEIWKETNVLNSQTEIINHEIHSRILDKDGNEFIIYSDIDRWENTCLNMPLKTRLRSAKCAMICAKVPY
jgi:hypothetical protein